MNRSISRIFFSIFLMLTTAIFAEVKVGSEVLLEDEKYRPLIQGKRIGLITNHTAVNNNYQTTFEALQDYKIVALFTPEHGFWGDVHADDKISDAVIGDVPIYSLYGKTRRPTEAMLKNIDVLVFDIQDIGSRSYTYISTLFYCMEEAASKKIPIVVLDRPNPMGGIVVDGPHLTEKWRSFVGYINIPYCHGMTVGELAKFFNSEYKVNAKLTVVPMKGWKRRMTFKETKLPWVPTSPQIPESDTPFFYPTTGFLGEFAFLSIGIGYTLPFKVVGAPWIDAKDFAEALNKQKLPGVVFYPFHFRPFFGKFKGEKCAGVKICITDPHEFLPVSTQYTILGVLKSLYEKEVMNAIHALASSHNKKDMFNKVNGSEEILKTLSEKRFFIWKLRDAFRKEREQFLERRRPYLIPSYA